MRRTVTLFLLIAFAINLHIMVQPAKAQNAPRPNMIIEPGDGPPQPDPFQQEVLNYARAYGVPAARDFAIGRMLQETNNVVMQEAAWALLENSFGITPCRASRYAICDMEFENKLIQISATSAAAAAACLALAVAAGVANPAAIIAFAICISAVAVRHSIELYFAQQAHRICYIRARQACDLAQPTPTPTPTPSATPAPTPPLPNPFPIIPPPSPTPCPITNGNNAIGDLPSPALIDCSGFENDPCLCRPRSPIIIDLSGNGFDLTSAANGVMFNITGSGREPLGWTTASSDDAFLALDLNDNGLIDDGGELFGNFTHQPEPPMGIERNGFAALAYYDDNKDGKIDDLDQIYSVLRLWTDRNHNGVTDPDELQRLDKLGVKTLFLDYVNSERVDKFGNEFRYSARVLDFGERQLGKLAYDVFLVSGRPPRQRAGGSLPQWPHK